MKKKEQRTLAALLLTVLLASSACGSQSAGGGETTAPDESVETTEAAPSYTLPEKQNLGGQTFTILAADKRGELFGAELNGDVVNDAVWARNKAVEDHFGIALEYVYKDSSWQVAAEFTKEITSAVLAGDDCYDAVTGAMVVIPQLGVEGYFCNINDLPIDQTNPWWVAEMKKTAGVGGGLYSLVGSLSNTLISKMNVCFFNVQVQTDYKLPDFYALVRDGKWTLDAMFGSMKGFTEDLNSDGKIDYDNDKIALISHETPCETFQCATECYLFESDGVTVRYNGLTERLNTVAEKFRAVTATGDFIINTLNGYEAGAKPFMEDRSLFLLCSVSLSGSLREMKGDFGILPFPKYDEEQESYHTDVSRSTVLWSIPLTAADPELSAKVLEVLSHESMERIDPAYFEVALKEKYSRDTDTAEMLNIIRSGMQLTFDGFMHESIGTGRVLAETFRSPSFNLASTIAGKEAGWMEKLKTITG